MRTWPFQHIVAPCLFVPKFYEELQKDYLRILQRGLSEDPSRGRFSRTIKGYDAYGIAFGRDTPGSLGIFTSRDWHDLIASLFPSGGVGYVNAGAHHHIEGSKSGSVHNDLNPVWFKKEDTDLVVLPSHNQCDYKTGAGRLGPDEKVQLVRSIAVIVFLCNDLWEVGDGGEVGLFSISQSSASESVLLVPPTNNSMIAFECCPDSYHAFRTLYRGTRSSVIMWLHQPYRDAVLRWGETNIERWVL